MFFTYDMLTLQKVFNIIRQAASPFDHFSFCSKTYHYGLRLQPDAKFSLDLALDPFL